MGRRSARTHAFLQDDGRFGLLLREAFGTARAVAHFARKLPACGINVVAARLANGRHNARLVEAAAESEHAIAFGLAKIRLRERIEGNQVELARNVFAPHEFDQFFGLVETVVDPAEHYVFERDENFDLRPAGIIKMLDLRRPIYKQTSAYGHFGRNDLDLPWEKLDKVEDLKKYL